MNTKQTIVLWYAGLALVLAFLYLVEEQHLPAWIGVLTSIVTISALLVYSLGDHTDAKGKTLLKAVGAPVLSVILFLGILGYYNSRDSPQIPIGAISISGPSLKFDENYAGIERAIMSGRITNKSDRELNNLKFRVRIHSIEPDTIRIEGEDLLLVEVGGKLVDSLSSTRREKSKLVDGHTFIWNRVSGIPPGETESFEVRETASIRLPEAWAWSFEVISAH